jgi:hypothetical protein
MRSDKTGILAFGLALSCAFISSEALAGRWEIRQEIREGIREVQREKREAIRELKRCETRECARKEIREGYREVEREKREARREIRREIRDSYHERDDDRNGGRDLLKGAVIGATIIGIGVAISNSGD